MQVTRETINKEPYLITDYIYQNDNVGINLNLLNNAKTKKILRVAGIPIDYSPISLNRSGNEIVASSTLTYVDNKIKAVMNITYPNKEITDEREINDGNFAEDMINTCLVDKKDIKNMQCYKNAIDSMIESVKENALEEEMLIKTPEFLYKCFVYSNDMELLGVAYRLIENEKGYVLGEYVGKKLSEHIGRNIYIDICINNEITLQLANVKINDAIDSSLAYAQLETSNTMVKRLTENYSDITMKVPKNFKFPETNIFKSINDYFDTMLISNSPKDIENFFKNNKQKTNALININKYLIS